MTVSATIGECFAILLSAYLCLLLASSWLPKIADFSRFKEVVSGYRILPDAAVSLAALCLVVVEVVLTCALLLPGSRGISLVFTAVLLLFYALVVGLALFRGDKGMLCGCGTEDEVISPSLALKDSLLAGVAFLAVAVLPEFHMAIWETALISIMGFSLFSMENTIRQLTANSGKGLSRPRSRSLK